MYLFINENLMSQQKVTSPEISAKKYKSGKFLRRIINYISVRLERRREFKKAAPNADTRSFDWQWNQVNYNRVAVVNLLLSRYKRPTYLEIGCASNSLFDSVPALDKTGVDPSAGGNVRATSDEFFASNNVYFDVVFIDGLHTYEQVRKDVINSLKYLNQGGWIALHDMLPRSWVEQHVPVATMKAWTGNVWKLAFELLQTEGIEFKILKIDYGVGVIKVINADVALRDLTAELADKDFSFYYDNVSKLPIVEWTDGQEWLRS
jgi:Methyltransferase domain